MKFEVLLPHIIIIFGMIIVILYWMSDMKGDNPDLWIMAFGICLFIFGNAWISILNKIGEK